MTGKQILCQTLRGQSAPRTPWVPFVGIHGASLINMSADRFLQSADAIVEAQTKAARLYMADGIPVVFDLQVEAEILGCTLAWAKDSPPSVASHPLAAGEEIDLGLLPEFSVCAGRLPLILEATRRLKASIGEDVALYGLITGPLTLAMHLRGDSLFTDMFDDEESTAALFAYAAEVGVRIAAAYLEAGADIIGIVDPMTSQISAAHFEEFVAEPLNTVFSSVREAGGIGSLFVCGNATRNLEVMLNTKCDNLSVDENVDLGALKAAAVAAQKSYGGNLKLTTALLLGTPNQVRRDAIRCFDLGEGPGFVLAPGCDLPYAVPPANLEAVADLVHDAYQRDIARNLPDEQEQDAYEDIEIPDYAQSEETIVDVVTLDSAGCAPCAYMVSAAREAVRSWGKPARVVEHKITGRDGLGYMTKLGVSAIPTICISGKPTFASIIPERRELVAALESSLQ